MAVRLALTAIIASSFAAWQSQVLTCTDQPLCNSCKAITLSEGWWLIASQIASAPASVVAQQILCCTALRRMLKESETVFLPFGGINN